MCLSLYFALLQVLDADSPAADVDAEMTEEKSLNEIHLRVDDAAQNNGSQDAALNAPQVCR